jgi:succinate dehydrogenase/fumarate reductase-like Fe-S protein
MIASLIIQRGTATGPRNVERFDVPFVQGQSVLDGLRYIRAHFDPTLAFRFSCINANACKECMMAIDDKIAYACTTKLRDGEMKLAPLPKKALVNDLVTEIAPPDERLSHSTKR